MRSLVLFLSLVLASPAMAEEITIANYRDLKVLRETFKRMSEKIANTPDAVTLEEWVLGADMASSLWTIEPSKEEQKRIATLGYQWAQAIEKKYPDTVEAPMFMGQNLLMVADSRGILNALLSLRKIRAYAEAAYKKNPRYMYASTPVLLGILYFVAPGMPLAFGDTDRAEELFLETVKLEPRHTTAMIFLAAIALENGKEDQARSWLRKVQAVPAWVGTPTVNEKDMDFWWHVDQIRATQILKALDAGKPKSALEDILNNGPRRGNETSLPQRVADAK